MSRSAATTGAVVSFVSFLSCLLLFGVWCHEARAGEVEPPLSEGRQEASANANGTMSTSIGGRSRSDDDDDGTDAEAEHLRIGVLGGIGFPRPLAIEGMVKLERTVALGVEYSLLPKMQFGDVDTEFWAIAGDLRIFPFRGGFFIGLKAGRQRLGASTTVSAGSLGSASGEMKVDTWFLNPRIGFLHTWGSGITLGIDAGVQLPLSSSLATSAPSGVEIPSDVQDVGRRLGQSVLPTIDLLRLGILL